MITKVLIVWFNNTELSDSLSGYKIQKWKFTHSTTVNIYLREYVYYFTQLYKNNWVFFDDIFWAIEKGIKENNNTDNKDKARESGIIDCYPSLVKRINKLLKSKWECLIISNIDDNRYNYLIDLLDSKKVFLNNEIEVKLYLKWLNNKIIVS